MSMLRIDGSLGEGGGQIVRSSLALSLVTGKAFTIDNIRARRNKPGLMRQHLTAVQAAAEICRAQVEGATLGSARLVFHPGPIVAGRYHFDVGTAGSTTLVLQSVLPAFLIADGPSSLTLEGGTHNPFAPPFDFLAMAYLPLIERMGPRVNATLHQAGFYPAGGGRVTVEVEPANRLERLELLERGAVLQRHVRAVVANLPRHIAQRECDTIAGQTGWETASFHVEEVSRAHGPGNVVSIEIESEHVTEVFTGFGRRGVPAERVAAAVLAEAQSYLDAGVPVGVRLADQLMLPLAVSAHLGGGGAYRTTALSQHSRTHLEILRTFLDTIALQIDERSRDDVVVRLDKRPSHPP